MKKRKKAEVTPELIEARMWAARRWKHSGLHGQVRMAIQNMRNIQSSPTTVLSAKAIALDIERSLQELQNALVMRVEPDGTIVRHRKDK